MNPTADLNWFLHLFGIYSYFALFFLIILEGPMVTVLSGLAVSLGVMNFFVTYAVIIIADLVSDILYYSLGKWFDGSHKKFLNFFKIQPSKAKNLEDAFHRHKGKVLFLGKMSNLFGGFVMYVAGSIGIPFGEFMTLNFIGSVPKFLALLLAGFFFGKAIIGLGSNADLFLTIGLIGLAVIVIGFYFLLTYLGRKALLKLERSKS